MHVSSPALFLFQNIDSADSFCSSLCHSPWQVLSLSFIFSHVSPLTEFKVMYNRFPRDLSSQTLTWLAFHVPTEHTLGPSVPSQPVLVSSLSCEQALMLARAVSKH